MLKIASALMTRLQRDEKGASAVEYAILVGVIGVALSAAAATFSTGLAGVFTGLIAKLGLS